MKAVTRRLLWGGIALGLASLTCGTGCGTGIGNENYEDAADNVQRADGSYMPDTAGSLVPETLDGSYTLDETDVPGTSIEGEGIYCVRSVTPGASHIGVLVNYTISDPDLVNEMGLAATSERGERQRFGIEYPNMPLATYFNAKRNFGSVGDIADVDAYAIDSNGEETLKDLEEITCDELDERLDEL